MSEKKSFIIHLDSLSVLNELTDEQAGVLFKAIHQYHLGHEPVLDFGLKMAFLPFSNQFKRDFTKYQSIVERNRMNGRKGGRPEKENPNNPVGFLVTQITQGNPSKPKKADSDSDSDSDSVNDNVKENSVGVVKHTHALQIYIAENFPTVSKMKSPLSHAEAEKIVDAYSRSLIKDILGQMENKIGLEKKYKSVYLTLNNWCKKSESVPGQIKSSSQPPIYTGNE